VTATLFYPYCCGRLQPFVLRSPTRRKFAETLVAKSDAFLFYKMRTIIEVPFAAIFAILAAVLMGDKRRASIVYNEDNYTLLRHALHAALSPQRTD
jgi:hypothetical protein